MYAHTLSLSISIYFLHQFRIEDESYWFIDQKGWWSIDLMSVCALSMRACGVCIYGSMNFLMLKNILDRQEWLNNHFVRLDHGFARLFVSLFVFRYNFLISWIGYFRYKISFYYCLFVWLFLFIFLFSSHCDLFFLFSFSFCNYWFTVWCKNPFTFCNWNYSTCFCFASSNSSH